MDQLVALNAIVEHGTFRAAAEHLNKAQSAVSHLIKNLEREVGFALFTRAGYRPALTNKGVVFHRHAQRVLQRFNDLKTISNSLNAEQETELTISVSAIFPFQRLLNMIGDLAAKNPATHIIITREIIGGAMRKLLAGETQIAVTSSINFSLDQVEAIPIGTVRIIPVAHPDFLPERDGQLISNAEMQTCVQVVLSDGEPQSGQSSRGVLPGGLRWTVSDFASKKEILLANMGWGGMPSHLVQDELENGNLVQLNIESYPVAQVQHYAVRRRDAPIGSVSKAMWEMLSKSRHDNHPHHHA